MRRASTLASSVVSRFLISAQDGVTSTAVLQHRIFQSALYGTTSNTAAQSTTRRWYSSALSLSGGSAKTVSLSFAGALFSVAAVTSVSEEVWAKEPPPPELVPKDVILYQYEACPFCNKVKGNKSQYDIINNAVSSYHLFSLHEDLALWNTRP